jgi:hypothetical protein
METVHPALHVVMGPASKLPAVRIREEVGLRMLDTYSVHPMDSLTVEYAAADYVRESPWFPASDQARVIARRILRGEPVGISGDELETARSEVARVSAALLQGLVDFLDSIPEQPVDLPLDHPEAFRMEGLGMVAYGVQAARHVLDVAWRAALFMRASGSEETAKDWIMGSTEASIETARAAFEATMPFSTGVEAVYGTPAAGAVLTAKVTTLLDAMLTAYEHRPSSWSQVNT